MPCCAGKNLHLLDCFINDFEPVVVGQNEELAQVFDVLRRCDAARVMLAGSGSAVLGFMPSVAQALHLAGLVKRHAGEGWFIATTTLQPGLN